MIFEEPKVEIVVFENMKDIADEYSIPEIGGGDIFIVGG